MSSEKLAFTFHKGFRSNFDRQSISSLGKVPIEILLVKRHITWVLVVSLFTAEFRTGVRVVGKGGWKDREVGKFYVGKIFPT